MRYILFILLLNFSLFANQFNIEEKYYIDTKGSIDIHQILNSQNRFQPLQKYNFGILKDNFWIHLQIKNTTEHTKIRRFYNKRAGLDFIDVFIVQNGRIIKRFSLGDMKDYSLRDNIFRVSYFDVKLKAFEKTDIYIKQKSYGTMEAKWHCVDINYFQRYFNNQSKIYFTILGVLLVATLASFVFFLIFKNRYYLIYTLFTLCSIIYQLSVAGFFYEFQIPVYFNTIFNYVIPLIALIFLGFFPLSFFHLKHNEYKRLIILLKILLLSVFLFAVLNLFYPVLKGILYDIKYTNVANISTMFILLLISFKAYISNKQGAVFYLISNLILLIAIVYFILGLMGVVANSEFYYYSLSVGSISQDIFLALALVHATYLIKKDNEKNSQLLNEYSKISFIGQTMLNISHQWKTPINNIYNSINHIEIAKEFQDKDLDSIIDKNLQHIKENTKYLKDTAFSQLNFYKEKKELERINVYDEIKFVIRLIESEFNKKSINVQLNCQKNFEIEIEKNYFLNVLMSLLENSFKIFEQREIVHPSISIDVIQKEKHLEIIFQDNGQGVSEEFIDKLFDKNYSLNESTGMGLYLVKEIVQHKLKGKINAYNTQKGLSFKIII